MERNNSTAVNLVQEQDQAFNRVLDQPAHSEAEFDEAAGPVNRRDSSFQSERTAPTRAGIEGRRRHLRTILGPLSGSLRS